MDPEKKSVRARERHEAKRAAWREQTRGIDPDRFVWIDETGSHLGMTRRHSRAPRGQRLAPTLKPDQIVVADNLTVHYSDRAREAIEARGAHLWHLPPYSPDLNPIEEAFSKVKAFLRTAEPRTLDAHSTAIWAALRTITPQDAAGWFAHAGYGTRRRRPNKRSVSRHQAHNLHFRLPDASPIVMLHVAAPQLFDHLW